MNNTEKTVIIKISLLTPSSTSFIITNEAINTNNIEMNEMNIFRLSNPTVIAEITTKNPISLFGLNLFILSTKSCQTTTTTYKTSIILCILRLTHENLKLAININIPTGAKISLNKGGLTASGFP